ncbi:MAG: serine hydrolase domain-containing protein [Parasphingopyxis sp.]
MIRRIAALLALCGLAATGHAQSTGAVRIDASRIDNLAESSKFAGVIMVSRGDSILYARAFGEVRPGSGEPHRIDARWRWASITKQLVATVTMQQVEAGRMELDAPISRYWPDFPNAARDAITIRHLLQHRSGLPDPDDTQRLPNGLPAFYGDDWAARASAEGYCAGPSSREAGVGYHYTNCDFIVLGAILERATGQNIDALVNDLLPGTQAMYPEGEPTVAGFHYGQAEPPIRFETYGAAGALNGTIFDLWWFDRALMRGDLLEPETREEMWTGNPAIGYAALGQWVFPAQLAGCETSVRLVERPGAIGGVQGRNYILPELDMTVITFTNRSETEFPLGNIAGDRHFAFALLSAAICPEQTQ